MWIDRKAAKEINLAVNSRPVTLLTGMRQTGKTSLLKKLFSTTEYITLDRINIAREAEENPSSFLSEFSGPVIIDEIQYAPSLFREIKIKVDENRELNGKWILTGSQKFNLMENITESLAGRASVLNLETLSIVELKDAPLVIDKNPLWKGGFPELWAAGIEPKNFFDDFVQTYLERDLRQLVNIVNLRDFQRFLTLLTLRIGQIVNFSNLARDIGVSPNTVKSWISILEASGVILLLPPYYGNIGKRLIKAPKLYFSDNGLACALLNIHTQEGYKRSPYSGSLWENFVFMELIKSGFRAGKDLFFYRDQNGVEIDFLSDRNSQLLLIEAKESERIDEKKLNFSRVTPLFKGRNVRCFVACGIEESKIISFKNYKVYNPLKTVLKSSFQNI